MKKVKKAIIPVAGLGTRFLPATKAMPKEMLPIVDKPTIQYIVEEAIESGIEDIIIATGKGKRYDVGEKLGFIQTTIEMALQHDELKNELLGYMENLLKKEMVHN